MTGAPVGLPAEAQCAHVPHAEGPRRLPLVLGVSLAALGAELVGGLLAHSLALLADAGHMLHHDQPEEVARLIEAFLL